MKCKFLLGLISLAAAQLAFSQTSLFYENDGLVIVPPGIAPNVDALNFVNNNLFSIQNIETGGRPYYTAHTLNYTNNGTMISDVGFLFETFDPEALQIDQVRWASSFHNIGTISCGVTSNALTDIGIFLPGFSKLLVSSSNIYSPGVLIAGPDSFVSMNGSDVNIDRGVVLMEGFTDLSPSNNTLGLFDNYWNVATTEGNSLPGINAGNPFTPTFPATNRLGAITNAYIAMTNAVFYYSEVMDFTGSNRLIRAVFIQNTNSALQQNVYLPDDNDGFYFDPFYDPIYIEWSWTNSPLFAPDLTPDYLYLVDDIAEPRRDIMLFPNGTAGPRITYQPSNFGFFRGGPRLSGLTPAVPSPRVVLPTGNVTNVWAAYQALFQPTTVIASDTPGQNATNMPGRIILTATNTLAMNVARIIGPNTMEISSPNQFLGNDRSEIAVPLASLDFRNTNGFLTLTNLMHPAIPRPEGTISLYSTRWTNTVNNITNHFHVLFVDARFQPNSPGRIQDLKMTATNIMIHDHLNVMRHMTFEAEQITVASNGPSARTPTGAINLLSPLIVWSTATPKLSYLTNYGTISTLNAVYFGGNRTQPYYGTTFNEPYQVFMNYGSVYDEGTIIYSRLFHNYGSFRSASGGFTLTSIDANMQAAKVETPAGDITLTGTGFYLSNTVLNAGRRLSLTVTNYLDDGGFTNGNTWIVGSGYSSVPGVSLRMPRKPIAANLLGTTITNISPANADSRIVWDGQDRGATAEGYANNAALGRLILDAKNEKSMFTFAPAGASSAIYVDYLELRNYATNYGGSSNFTAISVAPNMKVYFAQAVDQDGHPLAARLNGMSNGRLVWASSYAGHFSSTNMIYPDGSTNRLNYALVTSCDLDSDGDGIPNCADPEPVPPTGIGGGTVYPPLPPITDGSGSGDPGTGPTEFVPPTLAYPGTMAPEGTAVRTVAQVAGRYTGLFYNDDAVDAQSSGSITVTTTARGTYTAKLVLAGKTYPFTGRFNADGTAQRTIARRGTTPLNVELRLDLVAGSQIQGSVASGAWSSDVVADRLVYHARVKPCTYAGTYGFVVPPDANCTGSPGGHSFGTVRIDRAGTVVWSSTLADGTKVAKSSVVSHDGVWPLYSSAYAGRGMALAWVEMTESDFGGKLLWIKPAGPAKYYAAGFTNSTAVVGSRVAVTPASALVPLQQGFGQLTFSGDFLTAPFTASVYLGANNRFHSSQPRLSLGLSPKTGWFWGSVPNPETGKLLPFQGMLLQEGNYGAGFSWSTDCTGSVLLTPAP